jgi:hypothetical protein
MDLDFLVTGAAQGIGYEFSRFDLSTTSHMLKNITAHIIKRVRRYFSFRLPSYSFFCFHSKLRIAFK